MELTTLELELTLLETRRMKKGAAHVPFDARGVVPVPGVGHHDRGVADHDSVVGAGGGALRGGDDAGQLGRGLIQHL